MLPMLLLFACAPDSDVREADVLGPIGDTAADTGTAEDSGETATDTSAETGEARPQVVFSPPSLDFGTDPVGCVSARLLLVTCDDCDLALHEVRLEGEAGWLSVEFGEGGLPHTLGAEFRVVYAPADERPVDATVVAVVGDSSAADTWEVSAHVEAYAEDWGDVEPPCHG